MPWRRSRLHQSWLALTVSLTLHVAEGAVRDYLAFYNPLAMSLRDMMLWTWMPTFTFAAWLGGWIAILAVLYGMAWFAAYARGWMVWAALAYAEVMFLYAAAKLGFAVYLEKGIPGIYTAPLVLAASGWLTLEALAALRQRNRPAA
ncbi:MAG: hypothetical protein NZR01_10505 [Bryobacteraceae bacterium]|nr:hypothetical protein [Bryobacteraceae bacterium]